MNITKNCKKMKNDFFSSAKIINLSRSRKNEIFKFKITKNRFKIGSYKMFLLLTKKN